MCPHVYWTHLFNTCLQSVGQLISCHSWLHLPLMILITLLSFKLMNAGLDSACIPPHFCFQVFANCILMLRPYFRLIVLFILYAESDLSYSLLTTYTQFSLLFGNDRSFSNTSVEHVSDFLNKIISVQLQMLCKCPFLKLNIF
jgi:hypothetical protein